MKGGSRLHERLEHDELRVGVVAESSRVGMQDLAVLAKQQWLLVVRRAHDLVGHSRPRHHGLPVAEAEVHLGRQHLEVRARAADPDRCARRLDRDGLLREHRKHAARGDEHVAENAPVALELDDRLGAHEERVLADDDHGLALRSRDARGRPPARACPREPRVRSREASRRACSRPEECRPWQARARRSRSRPSLHPPRSTATAGACSCHPPFEDEVPDAVSQRQAATLEFRLGTPLGTRREAPRRVGKIRRRIEDLRAHAPHTPANLWPRARCRPVPAARPRAPRIPPAAGGACGGASSATGRERTRGCAASDAGGHHVAQHLDRVVLHDAHVRDRALARGA